MAVINPPEKELAKRTSVHCVDCGVLSLLEIFAEVHNFCCAVVSLSAGILDGNQMLSTLIF